MASLSTICLLKTTAEQNRDFCAWATAKYNTYKDYLAPAQDNTICIHIRTHIFTLGMKAVWREAEPYVGLRNDRDIHVNRLQIYHDRLVAKLKQLKIKLGKLAFPLEAAAIRAEFRAATERRRLRRVQSMAPVVFSMRLDDYFKQPIPKIVVSLSDEEADETVEDNCVICMDTHSMVDTCLTSCRHRFGAKCFAKWGNRSCPLCRTVCTEVTEYTRTQIVVAVVVVN
jgi:hypothetical protein